MAKEKTIGFTLGDIFDGRQALSELRASKAFAGLESYRLGIFMGELRKHLTAFGKAQDDLVDKYGKNGMVIPGSPEFAKFNKQVTKLRAQGVEVKIEPIPVPISTDEKPIPVPPVVYEFFGEAFCPAAETKKGA